MATPDGKTFEMDETDDDGVLPKTAAAYTLREYWDYRYEREDQHEWLASLDALRSLIDRFIRPSDRILMIGCGNSTFSSDLYEAGFKNIVNVDYSDVCIARMSEKHTDKPEMTWVAMDMRDMSVLEDASFDVVIDKAGMDAVLADGGDKFTPAQELLDQGAQICSHVRRVLRDDGCFVSISFGQPHFRRKYLVGPGDGTTYGWDFAKYDIAVGFGYFWYQMNLPGRVVPGDALTADADDEAKSAAPAATPAVEGADTAAADGEPVGSATATASTMGTTSDAAVDSDTPVPSH